MTKVLVTGCHGLLGQRVVSQLMSTCSVVGTARQAESNTSENGFSYLQLDVTDRKSVVGVISEVGPDVIVNCAAFTDVDSCEEQREKCWNANVAGVENLIKAARSNGSKIVYISTDFVFDGEEGPYDEEALPRPISYYGKSKLAGENLLTGGGVVYSVVRTSVLYGWSGGKTHNFVNWVVTNLEQDVAIKVVKDQYATPTLADHLAECIQRIIQLDAEGLYHFGGADYMDRYEFARRIATAFELDLDLISPIWTDDLGQRACRPLKGGVIAKKAKEELGLGVPGVDQGLELVRSAWAG